MAPQSDEVIVSTENQNETCKTPKSYEPYNPEPDPSETKLDFTEPPPPHIAEYSRIHVNEIPELTPKKINELRDMIFEKEEICPNRLDDAFLLKFLRARFFRVDSAYRLFVRYYKFKENNEKLHKNISPFRLKHIGYDDVLSVLPYRDQNYRRIMVFKLGKWQAKKYPAEDIFRATILVLELGILEPCLQILGGQCIVDLEGLGLQHSWNVPTYILSKSIEFITACFPMRIQGIHFVNYSWVFDVMYPMIKPMLHDKMREKLYFHGRDYESLHKHIYPRALPVKYGGTRPNATYNDWMDSLTNVQHCKDEMGLLGYPATEDEDVDSGHYSEEDDKEIDGF